MKYKELEIIIYFFNFNYIWTKCAVALDSKQLLFIRFNFNISTIWTSETDDRVDLACVSNLYSYSYKKKQCEICWEGRRKNARDFSLSITHTHTITHTMPKHHQAAQEQTYSIAKTSKRNNLIPYKKAHQSEHWTTQSKGTIYVAVEELKKSHTRRRKKRRILAHNKLRVNVNRMTGTNNNNQQNRKKKNEIK